MAVRIFRADHGYDPAELMHFARDHFNSAVVLRERSFECYDSAGFLFHLAFELVFKAAALEESGSFEGRHDLPELLDLSFLELSAPERDVVNTLSPFGDLRYPDPAGSPAIGTDDLEAAERVLIDVVRRLPEPLRRAFFERRAAEDGSIQKGGRTLMKRPRNWKPEPES